jgi:hypothetical protein
MIWRRIQWVFAASTYFKALIVFLFQHLKYKADLTDPKRR